MRPLPTHLSDLLAQSSDRKGARDMTVAVVLGCGLHVQTLKHSITWVQTHGWQHSGTQNHRGTDTWAATLEHRITRIHRHIGYNTLEHSITRIQTHWLQHSGIQNHMGTDTLAKTLEHSITRVQTHGLQRWNKASHGYRHIGCNTLEHRKSHGYRHIGYNTLEHRITWVQTHNTLEHSITRVQTHWLQHSGTQNHTGTDTLATKLWNTESHGYRHTGYNSGTQHHTGTDTLAATHGPKVLLLRHKNRLTPSLSKNLCCKPVWPSGKVLGWEAEEFHFGSPFSSKVVVCGHCLVTLSHN